MDVTVRTVDPLPGRAGRLGGGDMEPSEFLTGLGQTDLQELYRLGRMRRWRAGATLFLEGDRSTLVMFLLKGRVKVFSLTDQGAEVVLAVRGPGALLGEMSAVDGAPRCASVSALEPVETLVVPVPAFESFLRAHPEASAHMLRIILTRLRDSDRKRIEFGAYDTVGRVALRLVELAERFGTVAADGVRFTLPLTQAELAGWTGASREAVGKGLKALRDQGIIETRRRMVVVLDLDRLRARAR